MAFDMFDKAKISIHAPRKGSDIGDKGRLSVTGISIHAPRKGSDQLSAASIPPMQYHFNPRSPQRERLQSDIVRSCIRPFQSTLPAKGATMPVQRLVNIDTDFNPRSPQRERHSIFGLSLTAFSFQSTLPAKGAT